MKSLREIFSRCSESFVSINPRLAGQKPPEKSVQVNLAPKRGRSMSNAELEYAMILESMKRRGEIESYKYEGLTLKLADGCRFTPDFFVVVSPLVLRLRFVEVKGRHVWEDSIIKFRVAKEQNQWAEWQLHQKTRNGWQRIL